MKICVWHTHHPIATTVATVLHASLNKACAPEFVGWADTASIDNHYFDAFDAHIGYGILRNIDKVWRRAEQSGKPYFIVDRGYWNPGHYDGQYRVSLRGTQQTSGWPVPDWERWKALGLTVEPKQFRDGYWYSDTQHDLYCPPTDYVGGYMRISPDEWVHSEVNPKQPYKVRFKGEEQPIDWPNVRELITFNSSVGWEALRRGIPVESDPVHSIVGAWQAKHGADRREELFATMAGVQLTLDEMRGGKLMPLMQKLLDASPATKA